MRLLCAPSLGLVLLAGAVDFASARAQMSTVPFDTQLSGTASRVAADCEAPIARKPAPSLAAQPKRWMAEAPTLAAGSEGKQVVPDKQTPDTRDVAQLAGRPHFRQ